MLEPLSKRRSFDRIDIVRRRDRRKTPVSVLEALRSWRNGKVQPTASVRRAQSRSAVKLVLTTGACTAAMLLIVVPLLTLEADARGGHRRSLPKPYSPIVFDDSRALAQGDWCPGPAVTGCQVGCLRELKVFDTSQVLYDVLAIGIPQVDAVSEMRAVVYRHFSLPQSFSASRHQSEELKLLARTVGPIHPNDGGRTHRRLARNMHPRCPKGRPRHARTHPWAKAIARRDRSARSFKDLSATVGGS